MTPNRQPPKPVVDSVIHVLSQAKKLAKEYRRLTGKPLGIAGELLNEDFEATAIYEAEREHILAALTAPGSRARNERGALAVAKFRSIGVERWRRGAKVIGV